MSMSNVAAVIVPFGLVAWRAKNNLRQPSNYGDMNDIRNSLALHQWVPDNPVPVCAISEAELSAELSERRQKYDAIKAVANPTPDQLIERKVFEQFFLVPDADGSYASGTFLEPKYSGNAGFRRASIYFSSQVQREKERAKTPEIVVSGLVPVRPTVYDSEIDRIIDQQLENELMAVGSQKMADLDKLLTTKRLFDAGCLESRIRQLYSSSTGQKTFGICQANVNWPKLDIYNRFQVSPETPGFIPWGPVRGADLVKLNNRFEADRKRAEGFVLKESERGLEPIKEEEVAEWFADKAKLAGDGNAVKSMAKKDMEAGAKSHKLLLVRKVFDAVVQNRQDILGKYMENADAVNGVTSLIEAGKGEEAVRVVKAATSNLDLFSLVSKAVESGKGAECAAAINAILNPPAAPVETPKVEEPAKVEAPAPVEAPTPVKPGKSGKRS